MVADPPNYKEDWKEYWTLKFRTRSRSRLQRAAEKPDRGVLFIDVREIRPETDEYDYEIELEHLRAFPDHLINDAREGFAEFVSESDMDRASGCNYDTLPVHITGTSRVHLWSFEPDGYDDLVRKANTLMYFHADLIKVRETSYHAVSTAFECPSGHITRISQPIYTMHDIRICPVEDCQKNVYAVSSGTMARAVVKFIVEYDGSELECVATGVHTEDRHYENLSRTEDQIRLTGIPRIITHHEGEATLRFEALYLNDSQ